MKNIVLPTDFSDNSWNAIFTAVKLYADVECQFYILHAYEPKALNKLGKKGQQRLGVLYESLAQYSEQELEKVMTYLAKHLKNPLHHFESVSKSDTLEEAINKIISEKDIDLICMGTQGASGAKQVFMGSNTVKVLKQIGDCPILAVPAEYDFKSLKSLLFPTDFMKKYEKHQLLPLTELATLWKTNIEVVHVAVEFALNDQQLINQKLLKERLHDLDVTFVNIDFEDNVAHSLEKFITNTRIDLIALIRYRHSLWEKIIGEPVVKKLTFHTKMPLLVLPE